MDSAGRERGGEGQRSEGTDGDQRGERREGMVRRRGEMAAEEERGGERRHDGGREEGKDDVAEEMRIGDDGAAVHAGAVAKP